MYNRTLLACFSVLIPIFLNMSSIKWTMFVFRIGIFLTNVPFAEYQGPKEQGVTARQALNQWMVHLHIELSIKQCIKGPLRLGMPYWHFQVLLQERTHHLIQYQEQKIPFQISDIMYIIVIIDLRHIPQDRRLLCYPVLAAALGGEKNHRRAAPFMG